MVDAAAFLKLESSLSFWPARKLNPTRHMLFLLLEAPVPRKALLLSTCNSPPCVPMLENAWSCRKRTTCIPVLFIRL